MKTNPTLPTDEQIARELLPCPFCGCEARFGHTNAGWGIIPRPNRWGIHCPECGTFTELKSNKDAALSAWNRRVLGSGACASLSATENDSKRKEIPATAAKSEDTPKI